MAAEYRPKVDIQRLDLPAEANSTSVPCRASVMRWFSAEISGEYTCLLTGLTCVNESILVCDNENKCLKRFQKGIFRDKVVLQDPCGICKLLGVAEVAVTEPDIKQITFCAVKSDIAVTSEIKTKKKYECIAALDDTKFVVGCCEVGASSIDIIDCNANILRSIDNMNNGSRLFRNPSAIACPSSSQILISDPGTNVVLCISPHGDIIFRYDPNGRPSGVCVDDDGGIYIGHYDTNSVFKLTQEGGKEGVIIDHGFNIERPLAMATDNNFLVMTEEMPSDRVLVVKLPKDSSRTLERGGVSQNQLADSALFKDTMRQGTGLSLSNVSLNVNQSHHSAPPT